MAPTERAKRWRKGAGKGSARDQYDFGMCHLLGEQGVKKDTRTAAEWFQKAATRSTG
jgi:TPR repeat protein